MGQILVVGLGNPGKQYEDTRHNIGFILVDDLAQKLVWTWKLDTKLCGEIAKGEIAGNTVLLLKPNTYMNESGRAVRRVLDYYKWDASSVLVVMDDIAIPFGELRLRSQGSPGGHNGLKSIQAHLGSPNYGRLRMGIGDRRSGSLSDHVLGRFSQAEAEALPAFVKKGRELVERLIKGQSIEEVLKDLNHQESSQKLLQPKTLRPIMLQPGGIPPQEPITRGPAARGTNGSAPQEGGTVPPAAESL